MDNITSMDEDIDERNRVYKNIRTDNTLKIYTDGSCLLHKRGGFAYVITYNNTDIKHNSGKFLLNPITNQRTELYAIYKALRCIKNNISNISMINNILVISDSSYSVHIYSAWLQSWINSNTTNGKANLDLILKTDEIIKFLISKNISVFFKHISGHKTSGGIESDFNNLADELANYKKNND